MGTHAIPPEPFALNLEGISPEDRAQILDFAALVKARALVRAQGQSEGMDHKIQALTMAAKLSLALEALPVAAEEEADAALLHHWHAELAQAKAGTIQELPSQALDF